MFTLPENLTIYNVKEVKEDLLDHLSHVDKEVLIDAERLKDIDGAGIQLLLSLYKTLQSEDRTLIIKNRSELVDHLLQHSGAADILHS